MADGQRLFLNGPIDGRGIIDGVICAFIRMQSLTGAEVNLEPSVNEYFSWELCGMQSKDEEFRFLFDLWCVGYRICNPPNVGFFVTTYFFIM